ncbi:inorganic diphosphatase [Desulfovibrio sulfodismutans]|uniref:Inorganic pyrophosphatase n=1 Tax=Desulfolutivibrio sulfodismutans TaxID=63561 RepID=A0A7K3NNR1_9BACT|nr:inorganic diphosphatase [Desulfolutivibrio sulfodismutans]NDY57820.1 inorganic diphosphatase [Desulfolutivibrio sulfodismutans]QLA11938.1 inorganic pyrophosphatase [Desulfolutivibrio sulfodismutans DSM 3696]
MDYNAILTPYAKDTIINVVIEIPMGSAHKVEYDRKRKIMVLDRVEPAIFAKPVNYGFIPATLDDDGDELDVLFITDEPMPVGVAAQARVLGVLEFEDDKEMDHKVICVPADDRNTGNRIASLADLGEQWKRKIEHHFSHYKDLKKPGTTKVQGFGDAEKAHKVIEECIERWKKSV